jgi:glycosyltransferase involved in cell wall biosynthesis
VRKKKVLLVIDWALKPGGWSFLNAISSYGHDYRILGADLRFKYRTKVEKALRLWSGYIMMGFKTYLKRNNYDAILSWQWVIGLWYAIFLQLFLSRGPKLILMGFFYTKRKNMIYSWARYFIIKFALNAVDYVFCYSNSEAQYYNNYFKYSYKKFLFAHLSVNTHRQDIKTALSIPEEEYIFSSGSSNRDYQTLFRAVKDMNQKVLVVAKSFNLDKLLVPENVEVKFDIYGHTYRQLLWKSKFVVVSLDDVEVSSGQMVLLDAMLYGKVIIITDTPTTRDYVVHMENGILFKPHDHLDLKKKIEFILNNSDKRKEISKNARKAVLTNYSMENLAMKVSNLISRI